MDSERFFKFFAISFVVHFAVQGYVFGNESNTTHTNVSRSDFPSDFMFGVATAAAQIEGSTTKDGRGPCAWEALIEKRPEAIRDKSNMSIATDSYNRWEEDLKIVKDLGVDVYRFSISWTRIKPDGYANGTVNKVAIDHYNQIINRIIEYGIKPVVTLFHFDSPQKLEADYGGFIDRKIIDDFVGYAEVCFKSFGDRVKTWITINEPFIIAKTGYSEGRAAPNRCSNRTLCAVGNSSTEPYIATHHMLLAHASIVKLYRDQFQAQQKGEIGISLVTNYYEPYSQSPMDIEAQQRITDMELGWYMDPLVFGDYPAIMKKIVKERLPTFTEAEKQLMKGSFDFLGYQYYTARYVQGLPLKLDAPPQSYLADRFVNGSTTNKDGVPIGPYAEGSGFIYVYPQGLQKLLEYVAKKYENPKIYITENGVAEIRNDSLPLTEALNDQHRIQFIKDHLYYLHNAVKNGGNVKAYMHWTLLDDFEWQSGYIPRFGLYFIDWNNNLKRIPKKSAEWYHNFMTAGTANSTILH